MDDDTIGGDEMSDLCDNQKMGSKCWSPEGRWWNAPGEVSGENDP